MNLDPRSSKNYKKAIKRNQKANTGARFQVGDEMLTAVQIAELVGCSIQSVNKWIKQRGEKPENFIKRMQNANRKKRA